MGNYISDVIANRTYSAKEKVLFAIKKGDTETVKSLLDTLKPNYQSYTRDHLDYQRDNCEILLNTAIELKHKEIIELLVKYWDNVSECLDRDHDTPLMIAAKNNQVELAEILLNHGANVNIEFMEISSDLDDFPGVTQRAETALIFAVDKRNENIVKILLNHGANVFNIEYYDARVTWEEIFCDLVDNGPRSMMDLLMNFGPQSEIVTEYIFFLSIKMLKMNLFEELLERVIDIEAKSYFYGFTPLMVAIEADNLDVAQILLKRGANVNSVADNGMNALKLAIENNNLDLVHFLCNNGANVNVKTVSYCQTALETAITWRQPETVAFLLECGAQLDIDSNYFILNFESKLRGEVHTERGNIMRRIAQSLLMHVVKWQAEENFVTSLDSQAILNNVTLKSYYEKCKEEMKRVKEKGFTSTNFLLYDILKSDTQDQLANFARIEEISDYLNTKKFGTDFPIYAGLILKQFKRGVERKFLLQRVCNFFQSLSIKNKLPILTILCTNHIFDLLDNDDLINLRRVYYYS